MLKKYAPFVVGLILAVATIGGVVHAAGDNTPRAVDDPTAAASSVVLYGSR